ARRRLWRAVLCRHAENHRRPDGGLACEPRLRRLQHHVPLFAGGSERLRRQGGAGTAATWDFSPKLLGGDLARKSGPAAAKKPVFRALTTRIHGAMPPKTLTLGGEKLGCRPNPDRFGRCPTPIFQRF